MPNEFIVKNGLISQGNITISGSITATGGVTVSGSIASASYASNAELLDGLDSTVFTLTSSFNAQTASFTAFTSSMNSFSASILTNVTALNAKTASFATTGSNTFVGAEVISGSLAISGSGTPFTLNTDTLEITGSLLVTGSTTLTGSLLQLGNFTTTGTIIAQTINVQTVTSSIVYSSGSNVFGNSLGNSQTFTGSVLITGSLTIAGASSATSYNGATIFGSTIACSPIGCFATSCATSFIGGTMSGTTIYGSTAVCSAVGLFSGCVGIGTSSPTEKLVVVGNIYTNGTNTNLYLDNGGAGGASLKIGVIGTTETYINSLDNDPLWFGTSNTERMRITSTGIACFACQVCAPSFIGGTMSGTTIYGSTAVCSPVGKFTTCLDLGGALNGTTATFSGTICGNGATFTTTGNTSLIIASGATGLSRAIFQGTVGNARGFIDYDNSTCGFIIRTNESTALTISNAGVSTFVGNVCSPNHIASSTCSTAGLRVYGASGTHQWDMYLNGANLRFSDNTTGGCLVVDSLSTFSSTITAVDINIKTSDPSITLTPNSGTYAFFQKLSTANGDYLRLYDGTAYSMRFINGNVGINVVPTENLSIYGAVIRLEGAAGVSPFAIANNNSSGFRIYDYTAEVNRMIITCAGNVGIGTSTVYSGAKLHILGGLLAVEPTNGNTNSEILLGRGLSSLGTCAGSGITAKVNFAFEGSNDNFYQEIGFVTTTANQTRINSAADFYISTKAAGSSSPTERMRITSCGNVGIGILPSYRLEVCSGDAQTARFGRYCAGTGNTNGIIAEFVNLAATANSSYIYIGSSPGTDWKIGKNVTNCNANYDFNIVDSSNNGRMRISVSGEVCFSSTVCAPCFATISDYRMKSNIRPIEGLSIIMNTKPYKFEYNYDCSTSFGMIAHELQDTLPEAVFGYKDGEVMQGVDYMKLLPITIKAIQEQQCTICTQASMINTLKTCLGII